MIIDTLSNAQKYLLHPLFSKAFEYIQIQNMEMLLPEDYEIDRGQLRAIVSEKPGKTKEESISKFECHDEHIDIHLCVKGIEKIGWKPRANCILPKELYNTLKNVSFYNDEPVMYFKLQNRQFAIFFPEDVHAPMIGDGIIKKIVIKVRI